MLITLDRITRPGQAEAHDGPLLAEKLVEAILSGTSALVTSVSSTTPLLAALARLLVHTRTRVLHARPPLDLPCFMDQVAGTSTASEVTWLEQGFNALTVPGADCDRIALLIEDAQQLPPATLRYIELVLRAGPPLQVILAGRPDVADTLALDGFAGLRRSIPLHFALPDSIPPNAALPHGAPDPALLPPERQRMTPLRLMGSAVAAAGVAVLVAASLMPPRPADTNTIATSMPSSAAVATSAQAAQAAAPVAVAMPDQEPAASGARLEADAGAPPAPVPAPVIEAALAPLAPERLGPALPPEAPTPPARAAMRQPPSALPRAPQRLPPRSELVAGYLPATTGDGQRCRSIILRLQLGETSTDGDRTYLRNGCR